MSAQMQAQNDIDAALERRIECARIAMTLSTDEASKQDHWERMRRLIGERSPQQIERMERERGLRA